MYPAVFAKVRNDRSAHLLSRRHSKSAERMRGDLILEMNVKINKKGVFVHGTKSEPKRGDWRGIAMADDF
jgi:hypothetical protein